MSFMTHDLHVQRNSNCSTVSQLPAPQKHMKLHAHPATVVSVHFRDLQQGLPFAPAVFVSGVGGDPWASFANRLASFDRWAMISFSHSP